VVSETSIVKCGLLSSEEFAIMAPMGCGYITGAGTVINVLNPHKEDTLVILGMGAVGLSALMAAKAIGVQRLIAVDILDVKLRLAITLGATYTINSGEKKFQGLEKSLRDMGSHGIDHIIDTTGLSFLIEDGIRALGHGGTFAMVGAPRSGETISVDPLAMFRSCKRLIGVIEGASNPAQVSSQNPAAI
jgi:Zn-dependent alcohol dehydrogenase